MLVTSDPLAELVSVYMSVVPALAPQVAKVLGVPEIPIIWSVKTFVSPSFPSLLKLPVAVLGFNPAIRSGDSAVQVGVNRLGPYSLVVVIEYARVATLDAAVPSTVMVV